MIERSLSDSGLAALIAREGSSAAMYRDSTGLPTIGVGHLLTKDELASGKIQIKGQTVHWRGAGLSKRQIADLLDQDTDAVETAVNTLVTVPLDQNQFDALVSFIFNVGVGAFTHSTLRCKLNTGDYAAVPTELRRWKYSAGKIVFGLIDRRETEAAQWQS